MTKVTIKKFGVLKNPVKKSMDKITKLSIVRKKEAKKNGFNDK